MSEQDIEKIIYDELIVSKQTIEVPGQFLILFGISPGNRRPLYYLYFYQNGEDVDWVITRYPNLPPQLLEDTPRNKIKEIYGVNPRSEKL